VTGSALQLLVANHEAGTLRLLAVGAPATGAQQGGILRDLATLTGARFVTEAAGDRAEAVIPEDLGRAGCVRATSGAFTILGGAGDPDSLARHRRHVESLLALEEDPLEQERLRERLGRLRGGVAIIRVGGATRPEQEARKARAERAVRTLRLALTGGVAPGGGSAYLSCRSAVLASDAAPGERAGLEILGHALAEPLRVIAANAGHEPAAVTTRIGGGPPWRTLDARVGQDVDAWAEGILDPVPVLAAALTAAVSGASSVLSSGVLLHHREPELVLEP
jgi:chaperonin GroEL